MRLIAEGKKRGFASADKISDHGEAGLFYRPAEADISGNRSKGPSFGIFLLEAGPTMLLWPARRSLRLHLLTGPPGYVFQ